MSTRANVKIIGKHGTVFLYRHCDGYPEGLGEELKYFIQDHEFFTSDAKEFAEKLINTDSNLELTDREHGDIEYLYVIDLEEKSFECLGITYDYKKCCKPVFKHSDIKVLFADLDGTLINTYSGDTFPRGIWDMEFRFDVWDKIKELKFDYIFIVSNQGGIEKGFVDNDRFTSKMEYIANSLMEYTNNFNIFYDYCVSNDKSDYYRKPNIGMLEELVDCTCALGSDFPKENILMIGDASGKEGQFSDSDKKCAENFGIDYMDVEDFLNS